MTAPIGHNSPPPVEAFALHNEGLFSLASGSSAAPITTDEQEAALAALLDDIRDARRDADKQRAAEVKPLDDQRKVIQSAWRPLLDRCDAAVDAVKARLTPYRTAKQAAKDEAARIAREQAEAAQKAAQAAFKASDDLEERFAAEEQLKQAAKLAAQANRIDREPTGLRTRQIAVVENHRALLQHIFKTDPAAITAWLDEYARKAMPTVLPGVRIETERKAA